MGQGIAQSFAVAGHDVALVDTDPRHTATAVATIRDRIGRDVQCGKLAADAMSGTRRLRAADWEDLHADLVIEAVFEDLDVKREVFARLGHMDCVLASNTSSFPISSIAQGVPRPERVIGLHFFFPAHQNRLVEVVGHDGSDGDIIERARQWMIDIGKTPILVRDAPGFAINRFLLPMANEACRLVDEGHDPADVEASGAVAFQIRYGPFTVMDLSGTRVCWQAQQTLHEALGEAQRPAASLERMGIKNTPWNVRAGIVDHALAVRLRDAVFTAAQEIVEAGIATSSDVDLGARVGLQWPMGPFELMELPGVLDSERVH